MKKSVLWCFVLGGMLYAAQVEIIADKFFADEKKKISIFEGNVKVTKESDKITANKITVEFDDNTTTYPLYRNRQCKSELNHESKEVLW